MKPARPINPVDVATFEVLLERLCLAVQTIETQDRLDKLERAARRMLEAIAARRGMLSRNNRGDS